MNFIKEYFFYRVPKEEKEKVQRRIMAEDHRGYVIIVCAIILFQLVMLMFNLITFGYETDKMSAIAHRHLYLSLLILMLIGLVAMIHANRRKNIKMYFVLMDVIMICFFLWGVGITTFDSVNGIDLTSFAYVVFTSVLLLLSEPWVTAIILVAATLLQDIVLRNWSVTSGIYRTGTFISLVSICMLAIIGASFNFTRRVRSIKLEIEVEKLNSELARKAFVDDVIGVYSRHYLSEHINDPLNIGFSPSGVMMIDLDHFKELNDKFGHQNGDIYLEAFGRLLNDFIAGKDGYAVRYGGEEFMVFLRHTNENAISTLAEELRKTVEDTEVEIPDGSGLKCTVSIGIAVAVSGITYSRLIDMADQALYRAKQTRNIVSR